VVANPNDYSQRTPENTLTTLLPHPSAYLSQEEVESLHRYWRAANYLSVGQIYLLDNGLLRKPLTIEHIKPRLLGHWGTTPSLNFLYVHLNRCIVQRDLNLLFIAGPGHGAPGVLANTWLEGVYSERFPKISQTKEGIDRFFKQFSFPGGVPSHAAPETPGSIHEGGELGYSLSHAFGAVFDNPDLISVCLIGDGEAETGPLATSWHSNKFLDPATDGAVLPVLQLNGYKIANPTILARIGDDELVKLFKGYGYEPLIVSGSDPEKMHPAMAETLDNAFEKIARIQEEARSLGSTERPTWPMIILRTPKGWTGPKFVDGKPVEGTWRAHQVPIEDVSTPAHLKLLEDWMRSYRPEDLFEQSGAPIESIKKVAPKGDRRMGANPHSNGGALTKELNLPNYKDYAVQFDSPGITVAESTRVLGKYLCDVFSLNRENRNFRLFGPDETASNRLQDVYEATQKTWEAEVLDTDENLARDGRVMEILSEHTCEGWLEGYLLTGRHGLFSCYEAFIHIIDSMLNQHAKWIKSSREIAWRPPIPSLNYLLTSHVWRQDHNGFSHQDPGFLDIVANKKANTSRIYLPPDANCLLSVADHCLKSKDYINVIVAGKQPELQFLNIEQAAKHASLGIDIWDWASNDDGLEPDVVMACAGDVPTLETLAATTILRSRLPDLKVRVVNVIDLMRLLSAAEHPHGLSEADFESLFTKDKPIIFAFHGYPTLVHRLTYKRGAQERLHVHGFMEEGTTTTPFDTCVLNQLDRFHLVIDVIDRVPRLMDVGAHLKNELKQKLLEHREYVHEHGQDMPEIVSWRWSNPPSST
jgi:xylulose-5-phosphate/fructose-6-phosphate phosphoketolase